MALPHDAGTTTTCKFSNTGARAQVHVDVSDLQVVFKKGSSRLMELSITEPLAIPDLVENQVCARCLVK